MTEDQGPAERPGGRAVGPVMVVSNRGPLSFRLDDDGRPVPSGSGGGLASTLHPLLAGTGSTWVASAMSPADRLAAEQGLMSEDGLRIVTVSPEPALYQMAYNVVSNATLWFTHHHLYDLPRRPRFDRRWFEAWDAYREVNAQFAARVAEEAEGGAVVLVQDYHLSLVGGLLAVRRPDLRTAHFHHVPFAEPSELRVLPGAAAGELLGGLAGFGACGFHTRRWQRSFVAGYADDGPAGRAAPPATFVAPLGPNPDALAEEAASERVARAVEDLERLAGDRRLIVRVDRVELSKNLLRGLWAFDELFESQPRWRGRVVMLALAYASRQGLPEYLAYRSEVENAVALVNERWSTRDWTPVVFDVADNRARSIAALRRYDVLLVNPVRDGLNLVAKEGPLLNDRHGVLVLSKEAGAFAELAQHAVGINPFDVSDTAEGLDFALGLDREGRVRRAEGLRRLVTGRTAADWLADQVDAARAPTA